MIRRNLTLPVVVGLAALAATLLTGLPAQADDEVFSPAHTVVLRGDQVRVHAEDYLAVHTDLDRARADLTPKARSAAPTTFDLPRPDGSLQTFQVQPTSVMEPALAAKQPQISTWLGSAVDDPATTVALDITQMGLHASVRTSSGRDWFLDPAYDRVGTSLTLSYFADTVEMTGGLSEVGELRRTATAAAETAAAETAAAEQAAAQPATGAVTRRVYRLALSNDPSYAAYFGAANVDAEKATLVHRVNQIYNDDFGITLMLVADNDLLNFATDADAYDPDGPCGGPACWERAIDLPGSANDEPDQLAYCGYDTLGRNTAVIGQIIGSDHYDVGHLVLGTDGGGLADLGVVGWTRKADGCTGLPTPTGDYMAIDYVAHELGHEFGGNHTFTGCDSGNRNAATSVEPGSGSSVMAYAGICGSDNLQNHSDPYFSQRSHSEINAYVDGTSPDSVEIQSVALSGVAAGDTITLGYPGVRTSHTLTFGTDYDAAHLASAIRDLTGAPDMIVTGWGFDPWGNWYPDEPETDPDLHGFQVMFTPAKNPEDWPSDTVDLDNLEVTVSTGTAQVAEVSTGGPVSTGGQETSSGNTAPTITTGAGFTVPARTPFILHAEAADSDGETPVVIWEQNDRGPGGNTANPLTKQPKTAGPLFRIFGRAANVSDTDALGTSPAEGENTASTSGIRHLPDLTQVLGGNTNARTGSCATDTGRDQRVACLSEFLPTPDWLGATGGAARVMHFRATARDRNPVAGGSAYVDTAVTVDPSAGPFLVTSQSSGGTFKPGARLKVTWKVNGTKALSAKVKVFVLDVETRKKTRVATTKNDGAVTVTLPTRSYAKARIMVMAEAVPWYAVGTKNLKIT
ncbi:hypothetical protein BH09ACT11_BH09ACT11_20010 [soil metagenome]